MATLELSDEFATTLQVLAHKRGMTMAELVVEIAMSLPDPGGDAVDHRGSANEGSKIR